LLAEGGEQMPFNQSESITGLAKVIKEMLSGYDSASPLMQDYQRTVLTYMCRKLEVFATPHVSKKAAQKAADMGINTDLRDLKWSDQPTKLKDKGRRIFHLEHIVTVSQLAQKILELRNGSIELIEKEMRLADIAWILKDEDKNLTKKGYHSKRSNPLACYEECGIEFVARR
jgi:hypothetical protein